MYLQASDSFFEFLEPSSSSFTFIKNNKQYCKGDLVLYGTALYIHPNFTLKMALK